MTTPAQNAFINVTDADEYLVAYYLAGDDKDWLCVISRPKGAEKWRIQYRFRYYVDDQPFDSADQKNEYEFTTADPPDAVIATSDKIAARLVAAGFNRGTGDKLWRRVIKDRSARALVDALATAPFAHFATPDGVSTKPTGKGGSA